MNNTSNTNHSVTHPTESPTPSLTGPPLLSVKELAETLAVSLTYVYQMRACGFPMAGHERCNQTATLAAARKWIRKNKFRMVKDGDKFVEG